MRRFAPVLFGVLSIMSLAGTAAAQAPPAPSAAPLAVPPSAAPPAVAPPPPVAAAPVAAPAAPPAAVYVYPPPPYGYPAYAYARPYRPPETFPYQGGPVPPGFHIEQRPRRGLIISGALVLGIPWALGASIVSGTNFPNSSGWLLVPGLGPWITLAARHDSTCEAYSSSSTCFDTGVNAATRTVLVLDGLMQTAGAVMLIVGLTSPKTVIARNFTGKLRFSPAPLGRQGYGGFVSGEF